MSSESRLHDWMDALAAEGIDPNALGDLEAELIGRIGRMRKQRDRDIQAQEAAALLPLGASVVVARQGCHRSTVYRRVSHANKVARQIHNATTG